tara:strand:+ start:5374 stop:6315 length:942 start_codon:yes stop_codon:yes gene_type:complete
MKLDPTIAAVIDIGSNTIKVIVAQTSATGLKVLFDQTAECRISEGMYTEPPRFTSASMEAATAAIQTLLEKAAHYHPAHTEIVATSAVRDAENRGDFAKLIGDATHIPLRILSGKEEAMGIAQGIAQEPLVSADGPYSISDLGGGSLEWILQDGGKIAHLTSMQLGAVRIMNRFLQDPSSPISPDEKSAILSHCRAVYSEHLPATPPSADTSHWGTGGAFTISRLILATENGVELRDQSQVLHLRDIRRIEETLSKLPLSERQTYPGLPATRADILPVALIIIQALAEHVQTETFHHSFCNLRMGRVATLLAQ